MDHKKDRGVGYKYAWNKDTFDDIDPRYTDYVLGNTIPQPPTQPPTPYTHRRCL